MRRPTGAPAWPLADHREDRIQVSPCRSRGSPWKRENFGLVSTGERVRGTRLTSAIHFRPRVGRFSNEGNRSSKTVRSKSRSISRRVQPPVSSGSRFHESEIANMKRSPPSVKKTDMKRLRQFLLRYGSVIPRTTLRYAIERFPAAQRAKLLRKTRRRSNR